MHLINISHCVSSSNPKKRRIASRINHTSHVSSSDPEERGIVSRTISTHLKQTSTMLLLSLLFFTTSTQARTAQQALEAMVKTYSEMKTYASEIRISTYETDAATIPTSTQQARIQKNGDLFNYQVETTTMLYNDRCVLMVDEATNTMHYTPREKVRDNDGPTNLFAGVQEAIKQADSVVHKGITNQGELIIIYTSGKEIEATYIFLDTKTNLINEVTYYYNELAYPESSKIKITYKGATLKPRFESGTFSEKKYIRKYGNTIIPATTYQQYELFINEIDEQ